MSAKRKNLSTRRVAELFGAANGAYAETSEGKRREAIRELLCEFQRQANQLKRLLAKRRGPSQGQIGRIVDPLLVQGIKDWGLRIFAEPNPIRALEYFLGARQRPGKRAKNADRNFRITAAVIEKKNSGMTVQKATEAVASEYPLEPETIEKIYKLHLKAVKSQLKSQQLEEKIAAVLL